MSDPQNSAPRWWRRLDPIERWVLVVLTCSGLGLLVIGAVSK